jgi:transcription elongation factor Elf1
MKYTIMVPMTMTIEVEADCFDDAIEEAHDIWACGTIEMNHPIDLNERWEDVDVYNEAGDYIEENEEVAV